jgi:hypothetical protein
MDVDFFRSSAAAVRLSAPNRDCRFPDPRESQWGQRILPSADIDLSHTEDRTRFRPALDISHIVGDRPRATSGTEHSNLRVSRFAIE